MDIISQLRSKKNSQNPKKEESTATEVKDSVNDSVNEVKDSVTEGNNSVIEIDDTADESVLDPNMTANSSTVTPFTIMKLDFDRLRSLKGEITIYEILESEEFKIDLSVSLIVKKIEKFTSEICHMEMVDESGTIGCSCMYSLVKEKDIKIGSILKIKGFSLWKLGANHINLVGRNIVEVISN